PFVWRRVLGRRRLRPRVQLEHRALDLPGRKMRPDHHRPSDRLVDQRLVLGARGMQNIVSDFLFRELDLARMPDAKPQSPEPAVAQLRDDILEAVVTRAAAAELEPDAAWLRTELGVSDEHVLRPG